MKHRWRIAVIQRFLPSRSRGGVGYFTHGLCNALVKSGHDVTVFSQDPAPEDASYRVFILPYERSPRKLDSLLFPFQVARQDFSKFDVIHAQGDDQWLVRKGVPLVRTMHGSALCEAFYNGIKRGSLKHFCLFLYWYVWEILAVLRAGAVAYVSKATCRYYPRSGSVIPNGINLQPFLDVSVEKTKHPTILFVGEIKTRKRGGLLVDIFRQKIKPNFPEAELWIVAPEEVEGEGIRCFKSMDEASLAELYARAWVFCLPSAYEGFGRPYIEAMAAGTPVVATFNQGAKEVLDGGIYGALTSEGNLAKVLGELLTSKDLREDYARRGQERVAMYDWDPVVKKYESLYARVQKQKPSLDAKKKVLYLQSTSEIGGSDITLLRTIQALDKERFEPHLLIPCEGPFVGDFKQAGCRVHFLPQMLKLTRRGGAGYLTRYLLGYFPAVLKIKKLIQTEAIDLVHTNVIHNLYGFLAAFLARKPHIWHVREIVVQSKLVQIVETFLVKYFSSEFLVMSNAVAEPFLGKKKELPANGTKLYDGINLTQFSVETSGSRVREELGISEEVFLVGIVCRLDPWKGLGLFLEAAAEVHRQEPSIRFLVCGGEIEGHEGYEAELKKKSLSLGLQDVVIFSGWKYRGMDTPEVYRALNVSVQCPVRAEPYGLTNIEAMASQVPIVTFNRGGAAEICVKDKTALLVPPGDVNAIAEGVLALYRDPQQAYEMGAAGRRRTEDLFNYLKCTQSLEAIYDKIFEKEKLKWGI